MANQHRNKVPPINFAEAIHKIIITPDAPNNILSDWTSKYGVHADLAHTSKKQMQNKPTRKQLLRAKQYQRRTH